MDTITAPCTLQSNFETWPRRAIERYVTRYDIDYDMVKLIFDDQGRFL